jgi:hypothetical protein
LDIGDEASTDWKLRVVSKDGIRPPLALYLTLSYCWGKKPGLLLLLSNIDVFRSGRPIGNLPILFRDVVKVARFLSIQYIWIDSLCIIQDSEQDWESEASTMHLVYSSSVCTVSASMCASPEESLFQSRDLDFMLPGRIEGPLLSNKPGPYYVIDRTYWNRQVCGPLQKRGRAFQERILAPRVLYFGKNQLLWESLTGHRCDIFPNGIPLHRSDKAMDALLEISPTRDEKRLRTSSSDVALLWTNLVNKYSSCDLTYSSDKLPAIAGVAKRFQQITNDKYLAGMWRSHLFDMMRWVVRDPRLRLYEYRAPSWSWASVDGPIVYPNYIYESLAEVMDIEVATKTSDEISQILDGFVVLKCRALAASMEYALSKSEILPPATFLTDVTQFEERVYPDTLDDVFLEARPIRYVPFILSHATQFDKLEKVPVVTCLVLAEADPTPNN